MRIFFAVKLGITRKPFSLTLLGAVAWLRGRVRRIAGRQGAEQPQKAVSVLQIKSLPAPGRGWRVRQIGQLTGGFDSSGDKFDRAVEHFRNLDGR